MSYPNDPFYLFGRNGSKVNPYKDFNEPLTIFNGKVILTELPYKRNKVAVKYGNIVFGEVYSQGALTTDNVFFVDYDSGIVYFDLSHNGKQLTFTYTGEGYFAIPTTRIYSQYENGVPTQNIQDMIDNYNQLNGTDLYNLFDPQIGHKHSGAAGDAPPIDSVYVNYDNGNGTIVNVKGTLDTYGQKLIDLVTVNIREKGAKLDGITDDSSILQQWIDTLSTQSFGSLMGGVILIPGDMLVNSTINLKSNVHLVGTGKHISRIRTTTGTPDNGMNVLQALDQTNIRISNLRIEGTGYGASGSNFSPIGSFTGAGSCIVMGNCSEVTIQDCHLYNGGGFNDSDGVGNVWLSCCTNSKIINNIFEKGDNAICVDRWYSNYNADGIDRSGIYNDAVIISGNNVFNFSGRGVSMENINDKGSVVITGNTFTSCQYAGIEGRDFTNCVITGNVFEGNPFMKTFGNTTNFMSYGITIEDAGKKVIISNNNFQNITVHGISLINADEYVITSNRISNVTSNNGIFIKNSSPDGTIQMNMNSGVISNNLIIDVLVGIYIKKDSTDPSNLLNVQISGNMVQYRSVGIQLEYTNYFNVVGNNLIPVTAYGGTTGIIGTHTYRCQIKDNNIVNATNGTNIASDDSTNLGNRIETCTNGNVFSSCTNTSFADLIRGGTTAYAPSGTNSGVDATGTKFIGGVATFKSGNGVIIRINGTGVPVSGFWDKGDTMWNNSPDPSEYIGYICTTSGNGSTTTAVFKGFGAIQS